MSARTYSGGLLVEEWDDDARTYGWADADGGWQTRAYDEDEAAPLVEADKEDAQESTRASLLEKVDAAIEADLAYLELSPPTTAQAVAQVARLTRQTVALLRLVAQRLDDTSGT